MKFLLDFFFPITAITPTPAASTAFLKQVLIVVKPKVGVTPGTITLCTSMAQVSALTDNTEAQQLFNAGMSRVYVLPSADLNLETYMLGKSGDFYTLLISSDFTKDDIISTQASGVATITSYANLVSGTADTLAIGGVVFTAQAGAATPGTATFQAATSNDATAASLAAQINAHPVLNQLVVATVLNAVVTITALETGFSGNNIAVVYTDGGANIGLTLSGLSSGKLSGGDGFFPGEFKGVVGLSGTDDPFLKAQAAIEKRSAFHTTAGNKAKNMFYAFGKLLSNPLDWLNQQYITMPFADDVNNLGMANLLFDDRISMVISDSEYANRLALFAAGGEAIIAPYVIRNLEVDMQSAALSYISGNQPNYTVKQAALIQDELQKVIDSYIEKQWLEDGTVSVTLDANGNFVAAAAINVAKPKALWRIYGNLRQTL